MTKEIKYQAIKNIKIILIIYTTCDILNIQKIRIFLEKQTFFSEGRCMKKTEDDTR